MGGQFCRGGLYVFRGQIGMEWMSSVSLQLCEWQLLCAQNAVLKCKEKHLESRLVMCVAVSISMCKWYSPPCRMMLRERGEGCSHSSPEAKGRCGGTRVVTGTRNCSRGVTRSLVTVMVMVMPPVCVYVCATPRAWGHIPVSSCVGGVGGT